jgi:hypothetical protein
MPRWGVPLFFQEAGEGRWEAPAPPWDSLRMRAILAEAEPRTRVELYKIGRASRVKIGEAAVHPLAPEDDLVALPGGFDGPRAEPPGEGWLSAAELPAVTGSVEGGAEGWVIQITGPGRLVDVFAWPDMAREFWEPLSVSSVAVLMRYGADPHWTRWETGAGEVLSRTIGANRIELEVDVRAAGPEGTARLVVHDAWWPGWHARLDGEPIPIRPEGLWRAVQVGPVRHRLVMVYRPGSIPLSFALMGLGVLFFVGWAVRVRIRSQVRAERNGS